MKSIKKLGLLGMCVVVVLFFTGCTIGAGPDRQDMSAMIAANYPKVVSIRTYGSSITPHASWTSAGSGVILYAGSDKDGDYSLVATNMHVVSYFDKAANGGVGAYRFYNFIDITNWSTGLLQGKYDTQQSIPNPLAAYTRRVRLVSTAGAMVESTVLYHSVAQDLAIIRYTPPNGHGNRAVTLRPENAPLRVGEPIAAMGHSMGVFHRASVGVVSQVFPTRTFPVWHDGVRSVDRVFENCFMYDAATIGGNSGGPVFDAAGRVIGLSTLSTLMCAPDCKPSQGIHNCHYPALGFSTAISARVIDGVMKAPQHAEWFGD